MELKTNASYEVIEQTTSYLPKGTRVRLVTQPDGKLIFGRINPDSVMVSPPGATGFGLYVPTSSLKEVA